MASARRTRAPTRLALIAALCAGCGGQTGGSGQRAECELAAPVEVGLSEASAGFSAADVLAFAEGEHVFEASWPEPEGAPATGMLAITRRGAQARLIDSRAPEYLELAEEPCAPWIEIDVRTELSLSNERGTLSAAFDSVLEAQSRSLARLFNLVLEPELFTSDAQLSLITGERIESFQLLAMFSPIGSSGTLWVDTVLSPPPPSGADRFLPLARWPAGDRCGPHGHPVPIAERLFDVSPAEVVSALPTELVFGWGDGEPASANFALTPRSEIACMVKDCGEWCPALVDHPVIAPETRSLFHLPVELAITTSDERWSGRLDADLSIEAFDQGGLSRVFLHAQADFASAQALETATGLHGVSGDGPLSFGLLVEYTPDGAQLRARGAAVVLGPPEPAACPPGEMCPGAPPSGSVVLNAAIDSSD